MALTKVSNPVVWGDNVVPATTTDASQTSNQLTLDATTVSAQIQIQAVAGGVADANVLEVLIEQQDGANWDTPLHAEFVGDLDVGREQATTVKLSAEIPSGAAGAIRVRVQTRTGAQLTHQMTVTAVVREQRSS